MLIQKLDIATGEEHLEEIAASEVAVSVTNFNKNLTASETDVQKALDKIDDLSLGGDSANVQTLDANLSLTGAGAKYQLLLPNAANRSVFLPILNVDVGKVFVIKNTGAYNSIYYLTIYQTSNPTAIQYLSADCECSFIWNGSNWLTCPNNNVSLGFDGTNNYSYGIGIGKSANNNNTYGIGIGYEARINNSYGLGIGRGSHNNYNYGVGLGASCNSNYNYGVGVGYNSNTNYNYGVGLGRETSCQGNALAVSIGAYSQANRYGELAKVANSTRKNLWNIVDWWGTTSNNTPVEIFLDGDVGSLKRYILLSNSAVSFNIDVFCKVCTGVAPQYAKYSIKGIIAKPSDNASTMLVYSNIVVDYESDINLDCSVSADTTNGALALSVTGLASYTLKWNAVGYMNEIRC